MRPAIPVLLLLGGLNAALTAWLVVALRRWAVRRSLLDVPNDRSSHRTPTPRLGGVGITIGIYVLLMVWQIVTGQSPLDRPGLLVLNLATLLALVGLIDDVRGLSAGLRLVIQIAIAATALAGLAALPRPHLVASFGPHVGLILGPGAALIAVVWIVGFVNAFNFMDGIDGIAGSQAVVAGLGWTIIGWQGGDQDLLALGLLLATGGAGFLTQNWAPARMFMGDVGSSFLGCLIALLPFLSGEPRRLFVPAVLMVWPFVFDTTYTMLRRVRRGDNLLTAHRSHLYQRLTQSGLTHGQVAAAYALLAGLGTGVALLWLWAQPPAALTGLGAIVLAACGLVLTAIRRERQQAAATLQEA